MLKGLSETGYRRFHFIVVVFSESGKTGTVWSDIEKLGVSKPLIKFQIYLKFQISNAFEI